MNNLPNQKTEKEEEQQVVEQPKEKKKKKKADDKWIILFVTISSKLPFNREIEKAFLKEYSYMVYRSFVAS
jgi:FtsZ-interacting cell division protein ZipA